MDGFSATHRTRMYYVEIMAIFVEVRAREEYSRWVNELMSEEAAIVTGVRSPGVGAYNYHVDHVRGDLLLQPTARGQNASGESIINRDS